MDKTPAQVACDALDVLDRDGWCRHTTTWPPLGGRSGLYPVGAHCMGGLINIAACGADDWKGDLIGIYEVVRDKIREMYGWELPEDMVPGLCGLLHGGVTVRYVATWNDLEASEADVRAVLEKLAAG